MLFVAQEPLLLECPMHGLLEKVIKKTLIWRSGMAQMTHVQVKPNSVAKPSAFLWLSSLVHLLHPTSSPEHLLYVDSPFPFHVTHLLTVAYLQIVLLGIYVYVLVISGTCCAILQQTHLLLSNCTTLSFLYLKTLKLFCTFGLGLLQLGPIG